MTAGARASPRTRQQRVEKKHFAELGFRIAIGVIVWVGNLRRAGVEFFPFLPTWISGRTGNHHMRSGNRHAACHDQKNDSGEKRTIAKLLKHRQSARCAASAAIRWSRWFLL